MTDDDPREARLRDYRMTFATPHGQRVLADLKLMADRPQIDLHIPGPVDALRMACLEGHRQCYLRLVAVVAEAERFFGVPVSERHAETYLEELPHE